MPNLFYSDIDTWPEAWVPGLDFVSMNYRYACQRIIDLCGAVDTVHLQRPEIISSDIARSAIGMAGVARSPHLIFRPIDQIRPLKGAYNIAHVSWGFDWLTDAPPARNPHPFLSQRAMLRPCQEVWVGSNHSALVFRDHGVDHVKTIPCPVVAPPTLPNESARGDPLPVFGSLPSLALGMAFGINNVERHRAAIRPLAEQPAMQGTGRGRIYLTILDPDDVQSNVEKLLRGFAIFAQDHPEAILLVALSLGREKPSLASVQQENLLPQFRETTSVRSDQVIFVSCPSNEPDISALYGIADFYVCLSLGGSQNLALCDAMAHGVVPVSVAHAAMADFIDGSVGIVVPSHSTRIVMPRTLDGIFPEQWVTRDCSEIDYIQALERSAVLDEVSMPAFRAAAHDRAMSLFSPAVVRRRILDQSDFDFAGYL
jgi:hypothetical protein